MDRRGRRADLLARRQFALLARQRLIGQLGIVRLAAEVAVHPQPVHLAMLEHLRAAHHGDVVFGLAGDDARPAADALREVDRHAPAMSLVRAFFPKRFQGRMLVAVPGKVGIIMKMFQRCLADEHLGSLFRRFAAHGVDRMMLLRAGKRICSAGWLDCRTGGSVHGCRRP